MSGPKTKTKYVSKGERYSIHPSIPNAIRRERSVVEKWTLKQKAWLRGQNPWLVIDNPNTNETNKRKIRVRALTEWGDPKFYLREREKTNND